MKQLLTRILMLLLMLVMSGYLQVSAQILSGAFITDLNPVTEVGNIQACNKANSQDIQFNFTPKNFYSGLTLGILDGIEEEDELDFLKKKKSLSFVSLFTNQQTASAFLLPAQRAVKVFMSSDASPPYLRFEVFRI